VSCSAYLFLGSNVDDENSTSHTSAQERIERKLDLILAQIKAGHREPSILGSASIHNDVGDQNSLAEICRALEELGLDRATIEDHKEVVSCWLAKVAEDEQSFRGTFSGLGPLDSVSCQDIVNGNLSGNAHVSMNNNSQLGLGVDLLDMAGSYSEYSHEYFPPSLRAAATNLISKEELRFALQESAPLFISGALMFPEILRATILDADTSATISRMIPSILLAHRRPTVQDVEYPLLYPSRERYSFIEGFLVLGLGPKEQAMVGTFQGSLYTLKSVKVAARLLHNDTFVISADAYVWKGNSEEAAIVGEWSVQKFIESDMFRFYMSSAH
jgi:hypothetical protein